MMGAAIIVGGSQVQGKAEGLWKRIQKNIVRNYKAAMIHKRLINETEDYSIYLVVLPNNEEWGRLGRPSKKKTLQSVLEMFNTLGIEDILVEDGIRNIIQEASIFIEDEDKYKSVLHKIKHLLLPEFLRVLTDGKKDLRKNILTITGAGPALQLTEVLNGVSGAFRYINLLSGSDMDYGHICENICSEQGTPIHITDDLRILSKTDILLILGNGGDGFETQYKIEEGIQINMGDLTVSIDNNDNGKILFLPPRSWTRKIGRNVCKRFDNNLLSGFLLYILCYKAIPGIDADCKDILGNFKKFGFKSCILFS